MKPRQPRLRLSSLPGTEIFPLVVPGESRVCNPSIAISDRGVFCIIRAVNYDLDRNGRVLISPPEGFQSSNWFAELDSNLRITRLDPIDDSAVGIDRQLWNRLEDCRLFRWKNDWWFTATWVLHDGPVTCQIALCRLQGSKVVEWHLLPSPISAQAEKNWMPCVEGDQLKWIYWLDPMQVLTHRDEGLFYERLGRCGRLDEWAGSSALVRYRGHWLCVVHAKRTASRNVVYAHRFVELDDDFTIKRVSPRFTLQDEEIEFCGGLCLVGEQAILSYGVWDRQARIMRVDLSEIEAMLRPYRLPQPLAVAISDFRRMMRPWLRHRWLRQPGKQLRAIGARLRGRFGPPGVAGLSGIAISAAQYADLAMQLTRQCISLTA